MTDTIYAWSQNADDNSNADATINWAEYQSPSSVNDSARALMKRVADFISDKAPRRSSTGTGNSYVVASDAAGATYRDGEQITFLPDRDNTSACTLASGGRSSKPWRAAVGVDFVAENILANVPVTAYYRLASDEFISPGTGYYVTSAASGVALQSITARLPQIGDLTISYAPTPGAGRIRLTEATQSVLKSSYPELNSYLSGISYPWGSTATHFSLPPAAGYFLRFAATTSTIDTGGARTAGTTQSDQNKTHTHTAYLTGSTSAEAAHNHYLLYGFGTFGGGGLTGINAIGSGANAATSAAGVAHAHTVTLSGTTAASGSNEVRVKNVAFHLDVVASTALAAAQVAVFGFPFQWDTDITATTPGAGRVKCNNATPASMTEIYISNTDGWGVDLTGAYAGLAAGNVLSFSKVGAQATRLVLEISSTLMAGSGFYTIPVTVVASNGTLTSNDQLAFEYGKGSSGATGATGTNTGLDYTWSTSTSGDPGTGAVLVNHATPASATAVHISETNASSASQAAFLALWDDSTTTANRGVIRIMDAADAGTNFLEYQITGALTDAGGYDTFPVSYIGGAGTISNAAPVAVMHYRTGDTGATGATGAAGSTGATGAGYTATSTTSLATAGTGSKVFTTQAGLAYTVGARIRATSAGAGDWMEGLITAYSSTTLTVTMDLNSGTGTNADWNINLAGELGATGATGSTGSTGATGANGTDPGIRWLFDSSTSMADPGSGDLCLNNATLASVTAIAVSDLSGETGNPDVSTFVLAWDDSTSTALRGTLIIKKASAPQNFAIYNITGASTDNVGWTELAVTHVQSSGSFSAADPLSVQFTRTGEAGSGSLSGMTANGIMYATGATAGTSTVAATDGQVLIGRTATTPALAALSGDITMTNAGVTAIGATKVTNAMLAGSIDLTTKVTGTLPTGNGGTGITALGTGVATALAVNVGTAGAPVVNGGALGTPSSGTLTSATGLPISTGVSGLGTGVATFLGTPSYTNLAAAVTGSVLKTAGVETIWIPATAMALGASGSPPAASIALAAGTDYLGVLDFDGSGTTEYAYFDLVPPKSWNNGTITYRVRFTSASATSTTARWGLSGTAVSDTDALAVTYGTAIYVTKANGGTANKLLISSTSAAVTIAGTPATADSVRLRFERTSGDAADTMTEDARLIGYELFFTTSATNDA